MSAARPATTGRPGASRRVLTVAMACLLVLATGCGVSGEETSRGINQNDIPDALRDSVPQADPSAPQRVPAILWFVADSSLKSVRRLTDSPVNATSVLQELAVGPSESEQRVGLRSALPDAGLIVEAIVSAGTATVTLSDDFGQLPAGDQVLAIGQIVLTVTDLRGVGQVTFKIGDTVVRVPLPSGQTAERVSRDDFLGGL